MKDADLAALPVNQIRRRLREASPRQRVITLKFTRGTARMIVEAADRLTEKESLESRTGE